jgi:hypothetical protein
VIQRVTLSSARNWKDGITLKSTDSGGDSFYRVHFKGNDKQIGNFVKDVDGYYYFDTLYNGGLWDATILRSIADALDELNKPWNDEIKAYFEAEKEKDEPPLTPYLYN